MLRLWLGVTEVRPDPREMLMVPAKCHSLSLKEVGGHCKVLSRK